MQPERRKHVRILTIRNFAWATLALVCLLAAANIVSEMRKPRPGEFGRLTLDAQPVTVKRPQPVVTEDEVPDVTPVGPTTSLLTGTAAAPPAPQQLPQQPPVSVGEAARTPMNHVTIVGGPDGIHVESARQDATPKLSGGIFRQ